MWRGVLAWAGRERQLPLARWLDGMRNAMVQSIDAAAEGRKRHSGWPAAAIPP